MNYEAVYRTAPATPGLLISGVAPFLKDPPGGNISEILLDLGYS